MKIVHAASELFPYIKTGGLADAVGALSGALADKGHEVSVFLPGYRVAREHPDAAKAELKLRLKIEMGDQFMSGDVRAFSPRKNLTVYLICREEFYDRRAPYGNGERDYEDNADRFIFFRLMAKKYAADAGLLATFMPKPFADKTGNGAHFNMSLADPVTGENLFQATPEDDPYGIGVSRLGLQFIGGVLKHGRALCAAFAPTVNSYKRLIRKGAMDYYSWAPVFNSGVLSLRGLAKAEVIWLGTMNAIYRIAKADEDTYADILPELESSLVDRYFCNFSLFQSLPDSWAIDQLFPIMPIHRLDEEPVRRGTLQDVTCDSDGKIDRFVGDKKGRPSLELHEFRDGEDYILGIFLTGAYQEILGDLHNLFGDTNAVHVRLNDQGAYEITDLVEGDTVTEVLNYVQFGASQLLATFRRKVNSATSLTREEANAFIADYVAGLEGYTYLEGEAAR